MGKLKYRFTHDTLFKMLFTRRPDLLKRLVAATLGIARSDIVSFEVTNPEIPPGGLGDKFCRLDINMLVDGRRVNIEVQVADEGDYPERSLYHWAREYSSALKKSGAYSTLPRVAIISIVDFRMFRCAAYHSEFGALEVSRHEPLTDRMAMHYFEIRKLPKGVGRENELELLLSLFRARTEGDLDKLEGLGVPVVTQAIGAYRDITVSDEFKELERLRADARHNEASALAHAERKGEARASKKWKGVVADKDAALADKDAALADKDATVAEQAARIAELEKLLGKKQ